MATQTQDPLATSQYPVNGGTFNGTQDQYNSYLQTHPQITSPQPAATVPNTVDVNSLGGAKIQTPDMPSVDNTDAFVSTLFNQYNAPVETLQKETTDLTGKLTSASSALAGKGEATVAAEAGMGVPQDVAKLKDLNSLIATKSAEYQNRIAALPGQGRGITTGIIAAQTDREKRMAAVELGGLASVAQALQGNIALSQEMAKRAVDLQFAPQEQEIKNIETLLNLNKGNLTRADAKRADQINIALTERKSKLDAEKKDKADVLSIAGTAAQNGANNVTVSNIIKAKTPAEAIAAAGSFMQSPLEKANIANIYSQIAERGVKNSTTPGVISPTTQAIIDNPSLFNDLTPTEKGQTIKQLQANGYDTTNLGVKGLSDTANTAIRQSENALSNLDVLRTKVVENEKLIGPISGIAAINPYSKARKVQADINRVRQDVGKALEGGVLRKEDEEKYKKILAVITDTPSTALYKIDALIQSIKTDVANYKTLQENSGRSLNVKAVLPKKGEKSPTNTKDPLGIL